MKKLTKIKLINWHVYTDKEISLFGNTLISGENGAGKSTLIDAILFVISGGTCKFNTAANEKNDRNLESYVRGKLGFENKEYLRNGDTLSHIALEFFDDYNNTYSVIGAVITANVGSKIEKMFYHVLDTTIKSEFYYSYKDNKKYPASYDELKRNYNKKYNFELLDGTLEAIKKKILLALSIEDNKYLELLPKALAFKPIGEIDKFVFDYLLPRKDLDLVNMKDSVRRYRHLQEIINCENDKLTYLRPIKDEGLTFDNLSTEVRCLNIILKEKDIDKTNNAINEANNKLLTIHNQIKTCDKEIEDIEKNIEIQQNSKVKLENSDVFNAVRKLNDEKSRMLERKLFIEKEFEKKGNYIEEINIDLNILDIRSSIKESFYSSNFEGYQSEINCIKEYIKRINKDYSDEKYKLIDNNEKVNEKYNNATNELSNLEKGFVLQDQKVELLKAYLKDYFFEKYNKDIEVKAFYELVEVNDESYRNALEGYLNTRKAYLFIENKKYYDEALRVYEENSKTDPNLYGVGLVNIEALKEAEINPKSLASKLTYLTEDAKKYGAYVLGNIICVDNVDELKLHEAAITKSCMLYQGKVASKINPRFYKKYYLGNSSIQININRLLEEINKYKIDLADYDVKIKNVTNKLDAIERISENLHYVSLEENLFNEFNNLISNINDIDKQIIALNSTDLIKLNEQINEIDKNIISYKKNRENIKNSRDLLLQDEGNLNNKINNLKERIASYNTDIKDVSNTTIYHDLKKAYSSSSADNINNAINEKEKLLDNKRRIILKNMSDYRSNIEFHCDLNPEISNLNEFIKLYNQIENRNLIKYKDDARKAKEECEKAFKNDYIMKIRDNINEELGNIKKLNDSLAKKPFGNEQEIYKFIAKGTKKPEFEAYYNIFISNESYTQNNLFETEMSEKNLALMDQLFEKLNSTNNLNNEKELAKFTDYRNFMTYDIQITDKNGNKTYYSTAGKGKSGGETQTPFYVFIAASFEQIVSKSRNFKSPACLAFLDEAFNNMDDSRIQTMMDFYRDLNIQLIISVPTSRTASILKYCDTGLSICKKDNEAYIFELIKKDIYEGNI